MWLWWNKEGEDNIVDLVLSLNKKTRQGALLEKWATMTENICHPTPLMIEFPSVIVAPVINL